MPFDEIDEALRRQPTWDPPAEFSRQGAALAVRLPLSVTATRTPALTAVWHVLAR